MITLYSTDCPRCIILEKKLKEKNIDFKINKDIDKITEMGFTTAPILVVDGNILSFGDANKWINEQEAKVED